MENKDFKLSKGQSIVMAKFIEFVNNSQTKVFILRGYAGTGKTTVVNEMIKHLRQKKEFYQLLASTGRAAKIMSNITGEEAKTVHSLIYKYQDFNQDLETVVQRRDEKGFDDTGQLFLNFALQTVKEQESTVFYIVDESSMISDQEDKAHEQAVFGSGRLLKDLLQHDRKGKFIFVGDVCQLPPVSQRFSPALSAEYFNQEYGLKAVEVELTEIMRQGKDNGIISASQKIRQLYKSPQPWKWAKFQLRRTNNIHLVGNQFDLLQLYIKNIKNFGFNNSTLLCQSNRQCNKITEFIRPSLGINSATLTAGDLLLVTQNNLISGLMNGDLVTVEKVGATYRRANLTFIDVKVKELFSKQVYSQLLIAEVVYGNQTNLSSVQQKELFVDFYIRMKEKGIKQDTEAFKHRMCEDPFLNALRSVYGYALTCHKAQGGEWTNTFLDIPRNFPLNPRQYTYQWLYTAMTRARENLYLVDDFYLI